MELEKYMKKQDYISPVHNYAALSNGFNRIMQGM
ncbi:MAG: hypothetical protein K0R00_2894 [Herbinix sp.]|nr:hypothetical protein [Herbinix sp.]